MSRLSKPVNFEPAEHAVEECLFSFDIPEVPLYGARIRVVYAGACYRAHRVRFASVCSTSSVPTMGMSSEMESLTKSPATAAHVSRREGDLFPSFEVSGIIDAIGKAARNPDRLQEGTRVAIYPFGGMPHEFEDFIVVPDFKSLVKVPNALSLSVAAMLPTGARLVMNTVYTAMECLKTMMDDGPNKKDRATVLIVGTGGLALWALRIATHCFRHQTPFNDRITITVATLKNEGFIFAEECNNVKVVQWQEDCYEDQLIERTIDACGGPVDVVLNYGTTSRSLHRSLQCLAPGGVALATEEVGDRLLPKFAKKAEEMNVNIMVVADGSVEQLKELVAHVARGDIEPPPHEVFSADNAREVARKLAKSEIKGRAILQFQNVF